ncbi:MAG: hypothetical protein WCK98_03835 [bacterium]
MVQKLVNALPIASRWKLAFKTAPFIALILIVKTIANYFKLDLLSLNPLFTAIISANIFLIGFLITGVLSDYKESERLPGDLSASIESMADEGLILYKDKATVEAKDYIKKLLELNSNIILWFHKQEKTETLYKNLLSLNDSFLAFEKQTQSNFIVRLKQEQNIIRRLIRRIHTIRETSFLGTGYAIAEIITSILVLGFIFINMNPFHESLFFVGFISFVLIYMIFFIKDLDNPFGYSLEDNMVEEISLKPILDSKKRLQIYYNQLT